MRRVLGALMLAACLATPAEAPAAEPLPALARVGPWPVISRLIGFRDRLWFANSLKGRNHNSADLYSIDSTGGELRYETHLFSQDAGRPVVADGWLIWPFEDSRASLGWGHFMATDGRDWRFGTIPTARIFHVHALAQSAGRLVAATSAWRAGLQVSDDDGLTWRQVYDHPTPEGRVSRIVDLIALGDRVLASLVLRDERRVLRLAGVVVEDLPGWPANGRLRGWAVFEGRVYALVAEAGGVGVWRSDGRRAERLVAPRPDWTPLDLAAGAGALWAAGGDGRLWRSPDGLKWAVHRRLEGGRPYEVTVYRGRVYVGGAGDDGRGILWGEEVAASDVSPPGPPAAARPAPIPETRDRAALGAALDRALADPASYGGHAGTLRDLVYEAATGGPPPGFLARRWEAPWPALRLSLVGGQTTATAEEMGHWVLLWGMAVAGEGEVPREVFTVPWTAEAKRSEKYFKTLPAALWAAARIGQDDGATLGALVARVDQAGDPLWLTGDVVGALTALTGRRFGYDRAAWRAWWEDGAEAKRSR